MDTNLEDKYQRLKDNLRGMGSVLLSFSGGTDSTLLLAVAKESLKDNVIAATIHSPLHPRTMLEHATSISARIRAEHIVVDSDEIANEAFATNPPERCYLCKHERFSKLIDIATREGIAEVADGTHAGDSEDYRPGIEAALELDVRSPLADAGFAKFEIRALSRELGLPTWNMPPSTCLATRVPYRQEITREKLSVIEEAESFLLGLGLAQVRLRLVNDVTARIEVGVASLPTLVAEGMRERVLDKMKKLGFTYVTVDLEGYRSGSLNEVLPGEE